MGHGLALFGRIVSSDMQKTQAASSRDSQDRHPTSILLKLAAIDGGPALLSRMGITHQVEERSAAEVLIEIKRRTMVRLLAVAGSPDEITTGGFLAPLAAAALRPTEVIEISSHRATVRRSLRRRYIAARAPRACAQVLVSALAIGLQRVLVEGLRRFPRVDQVAAGPLEHVCYLRSSVGAGSTVGGSVTHAHEVIRAMRRQGIRVTCITTDESIARAAYIEPDPPCDWLVHAVGNGFRALPASLGMGCDIALLLRGLRPSIAPQIIYQRHARFTMAGVLLARLQGVPLFLEYNGPVGFWSKEWQPTPLHRQLVTLEDAVLASATRIFAVSDVLGRSLTERGIGPDRIVVNPNGVDAERFIGRSGETVRELHRIDPRDVTVGFLGSFGPWHGSPQLARAFATVVQRVPQARLLLMGDGPERHVTLDILDHSVARDRVTFVGRVPPSSVPEYLAACDVLVSPHVPLPGGTEFFGSPTKVFEYMAAGRAIVASALGQIADVLADGETALLVPPGDEAALADALIRALLDPQLRERLGKRAQHQARAHHSWSSNVKRVTDAYAALRTD